MTVSVIKANLGYARSSSLRGWVAQLTAAFRGWRDRTSTLRELNRLDERALRDIGVDRYGLRGLVDARLAERELRQRGTCWI
jgi:uncharacterized protein YjiS (DUF1127 family)